MSWLDPFWIPIEKNGVVLAERRKLILGEGIVAIDVPDQEALFLDVAGGVGEDGEDGEDGADGAPGSVWRSGEGAPSNGLGIDGDFYLRTSNGAVYAKASGTYSVVDNLTGPAGAGVGALGWSPVDWCTANSSDAPGNGAGSTSTAIKFSVTEGLTIAGARFAWGHSSPTNVKVSLWTTSDHTRQRNVTVAVSGVGVFTAEFASPFTVPSTNINRILYLAIWDTSGAQYTQCAPEAPVAPSFPVMAGKVNVIGLKAWGAGDVEPTSTATTEIYAVEPIFV